MNYRLKAIFLSSIALLAYFNSAGQGWINQDTLYFDGQGQLADSSGWQWKRAVVFDSVRGVYLGHYKDWNQNNQLIRSGSYNPVNGKKDGPWYEYFASGKIRTKGYFLDGYKTGKWEFFHPNGRKSAVVYFSDHPLQLKYDPDFEFEIWEAYDQNGKKLIYNGTGILELTWQDSLVLRGGVKDGKRSHSWSLQKASGELLIQEYYQLGHFVNGTHADGNGFIRQEKSLIDASIFDCQPLLAAEKSLKAHFKQFESPNWVLMQQEAPALLMGIDNGSVALSSFGNSNYPLITAYHDYQSYLEKAGKNEDPERRYYLLCKLDTRGKIAIERIFNDITSSEKEKITQLVESSPNWINFGNGIIPRMPHYLFFTISY